MKNFIQWLKSRKHQEGDVVPKTKNSETSLLAKALVLNNLNYEVENITEDVYYMLKRKRESIKKYKSLFVEEGLKQWYELVLHQTDSIRKPLNKYQEKNARYLYKITK